MTTILNYNQPSTLPPVDNDSEMLAEAIGLKDENGTVLLDIEKESFVSARTKTQWKPSLSELKTEVRRRYTSDGAKAARVPGFSSWTVPKFVRWL